MDIFRGLKFSPNAEIGENISSLDGHYLAERLSLSAILNPGGPVPQTNTAIPPILQSRKAIRSLYNSI
jgi:hypothetical protein